MSSVCSTIQALDLTPLAFNDVPWTDVFDEKYRRTSWMRMRLASASHSSSGNVTQRTVVALSPRLGSSVRLSFYLVRSR